jgi:hypothetical protein
MRPRHLILLPILLTACEKDDTGVQYGIFEGELSFDDGEVATVATHTAFGYDAGGKALLYFASSESATCADVTDFLSDDSGDPSSIFAAGHCNIFAQIQDWDGSEVSYTSDPVKVTWALNCTVGEGAWNWEERGDDDGFYWSGRFWQGSPQAWSITASGGGGDPFVIDVEMNDYTGDYIYEFTDMDGSGLVSGTTQVEWCETLSETAFFGS